MGRGVLDTEASSLEKDGFLAIRNGIRTLADGTHRSHPVPAVICLDIVMASIVPYGIFLQRMSTTTKTSRVDDESKYKEKRLDRITFALI